MVVVRSGGQAMPSEGLAASAPVSDGMTWRTVCFQASGQCENRYRRVRYPSVSNHFQHKIMTQFSYTASLTLMQPLVIILSDTDGGGDAFVPPSDGI